MARIRCLSALLLGSAVCLTTAPGAAPLVINELAPDPAGADAGREFVEILNTSDLTTSLAGVSLEFANGAEGPVWRVRWTAGPDLTLGPGARFLLADRNWQGPRPADVEVWLGLQNGPDAVRLVRGDTVLDLVGWGALTDADLMEGTPAPRATGASLGRRPDGRDTEDNGTDFVIATPTPGAPNFRPWALTVVATNLDPPSLGRPGESLRLDGAIRNDGLESWPVTLLALRAGGQGGTVLLDACPPGDVREFSWQVRPPAPGRIALSGTAIAPGGADTLDLVFGAAQVGAGPLVLSEVMAAPRRSEGEWVEVEAVAAGDLGRWRLRDEDGEWRPLPAYPLQPGARVLLAQDADALAAWLREVRTRGGLADCDAADPAVFELSGWPNLNNTAPAGRAFAERLLLADTCGTVIDHVVVGGRDGRAPEGLSWERASPEPLHPIGVNWGTCTAPTGATPGCPNSLSIPGRAEPVLTVEPPALDPAAGVGAVHLRFRLDAGEVGWRMQIYDLWGAPVRDFGGDDLGAGPRDLVWNGRGDGGNALPAGGYVALLVVLDAGGRPWRRERVVVVIR